MDPISALGLAASIIAVIQLSRSVLKNVGPSAYNKADLNRLLGLASGFKGAYESLEYRLEYSEDNESRATLLRQLEEPAKECKLVLECLRERLENINFVRQYIVGNRLDKKFKACMDRLKDQKELFELLMQADQQVMLREIKQFSRKTQETILIIQDTVEETGSRIESIEELTKEHHEKARAHYTKIENTLEDVSSTILAQATREEEERRSKAPASCNNPQMQRAEHKAIVANQKAILSWLSNTDPLPNHSAAKAKHEKTTGNWFIKGKTYSEWKTNPNSFLWLHGIPGCGKSVLCSTIVDETQIYCSTNTSGVSELAYYYFTFTDSEKQKPSNILRSIIAQLVCNRSAIPDSVQKLYNSYRTSEPPLETLIAALKSVLEASAESFIILDALDECPRTGRSREQLCEILAEISKWSIPHSHVLVTSRKEPDIEEALSEIKNSVKLPIQNAEVDADIRVYVKSQIAKDAKLSRWADKVGKIETTLVEKADGMFRWVFCQLEGLRKCRSQNEILRALKTLPKDLNETYQRILDGIDKEDHTLAMNALRWLSFSKRPLRVEELAEASIFNLSADTPFDVGDRFQDPRDILQVLSSLVSTDPKSLRVRRGRSERAETIKIAHFSVQEYLMSDRMPSRLAKIFQVQELASHQTITECCLHYINFCKIRTKYKTYPLFSYSSKYWVDHAKLCNDTECARTDLACRFLSTESCVSNWFPTWHADWRYPGEKVPALSWAAFLGITGVARKLIHSGANVNALAGYYGTALQAACMTGHETVANLLLSRGADVNAQGGYYGNAFQAACYAGQLEIASLLLEKGADINAQRGYYGNALQAACYARQLEIANLLLEKGADANTQGGYYGNALQAACYVGHLKIANLLLERGADVNAQGGAHDNALRGASLAGHLTIVNLLLEKGADINAQGGNYKNAIDAALQGIRQYRGNSEVVQTLLEHGAAFDDEGNDAMIRASSAKDYIELAGLLVSRVKRTR